MKPSQLRIICVVRSTIYRRNRGVYTAYTPRSPRTVTTIEGSDEIHALTLISELGTDFTKWPTAPSVERGMGIAELKKSHSDIPRSALRTPHSALERLGAPKAITATAHKLARILYNLMRYGVEYMKKTEAEYAEQERARQEKSFHRRAKELGYEVRRPPANDEPIPAIA